MKINYEKITGKKRYKYQKGSVFKTLANSLQNVFKKQPFKFQGSNIKKVVKEAVDELKKTGNIYTVYTVLTKLEPTLTRKAEKRLGLDSYLTIADMAKVTERVLNKPAALKGKAAEFISDAAHINKEVIDGHEFEYLLHKKYEDLFYSLDSPVRKQYSTANTKTRHSNEHSYTPSPRDERLIKNYTGNYSDFFSGVRNLESGKVSPLMKKAILEDSKNLNDLITKNKFKEDTEVFRGVSDFTVETKDGVKKLSELTKGDEFTNKGKMSTTFNEGVTYNFAKGQGVVLKLSVPGGKQSFLFPNVSDLSQYRGEIEALLPEGLKLKVKEIGETTHLGKKMISLEILNPYGVAIPATLGASLLAYGLIPTEETPKMRKGGKIIYKNR